MELEVGMHTRLNGKIGKIIDICTCEQCEKRGYYEPTIEYSHNERENISVYWKEKLKASYNIIDLIEERDFVKVRIDGIFINWFMVDLFEDEDGNQELGIGCYEDGLLNSISEYRPLNTLEVLEVVTKEQFESRSYKVGV